MEFYSNFYWDKEEESWYNVDCKEYCIPEKFLDKLEAASFDIHNNKNFIIIADKRYCPGLNTKYFYFQLRCFKILENRPSQKHIILHTVSPNYTGICRIPFSSIQNPDVLNDLPEDPNFVVDFIDKWIDDIGSTEKEKYEICKKEYQCLSDSMKLAYKLNGKYNFPEESN